MLRGTFAVKGAVESARAYVTSLGLYELEINGKRVGDQLFTPGWTSYHHRLQYQTYDVTSHLRAGENAIGATLGDGWYRGFLAWTDRRARLRRPPRAPVPGPDRVRGRPGRDRGDGRDVEVGDGPDPQLGHLQRRDLRRPARAAGLERPGLRGRGLGAGRRGRKPAKRALVAPAGPPVRRIEEVRPVKILKTPAGETVFDMGQNMVGHVRLKVRGPGGHDGDPAPRRGARQGRQLLHGQPAGGEAAGDLRPQGRRARRCTSRTSRFQGFRYVAVEGWPGEPTLDGLTGVVVHSDMPVTGQFTTSNPLLNQLQHNIRWGQKGNFLDVPTDCPQRDERLGWTGDAQVFSRTAAFNMDVAGFFTKWLGDVAADQNEKGSVPFVVPDVLSRGGQVRRRLRRLGRRRHDHPLEHVPRLRRRAAPRAAVPEHEGVGRVHAARGRGDEPLDDGLPLRRLARLRHDRLRLPGRHDRQGPDRERLLRPLDRPPAAGGGRPREEGGRGRVRGAPAEDQGGVPEGVRDRRRPRRREHPDGLRRSRSSSTCCPRTCGRRRRAASPPR